MTGARVDLFALGGTIASLDTRGRGGVTPTLQADTLISAVPGLEDVAIVRPHQFSMVPSSEIRLEALPDLVARMQQAVGAGAAGIVVTQGTDSIEEVAFGLDLLWGGDVPVVVTGAMRSPDRPGADGAANLLAAVRVAASPAAWGSGVSVVLDDTVHAARWVRKVHTSRPSAFSSEPAGPVGWVSEDRVRLRAPLRRLPTPLTLLPGDQPLPDVALVRIGLGDTGRLLESITDAGFAGVVIEGLGGGHVPVAAIDAVQRLHDRMPVLLSSRTGGGEVLRRTYDYPGSEMDLIGRGLLATGTLDGLKARILLILALAADRDRAGIAALLNAYCAGD